ncbi:ATP-grasp domain-containing protein [Bacillus pseudomycoides]|uniref:ATP-grasp domain-containing protein n=1 Tax=Bacillus TaxID=1386 RepID=UPI00036F8ED9|nr:MULTISPECIES: ATP-grasp domain-containing protein [Bacillus]MCX2829633.1 ATP-grasp domain-containing protein [Bacillus sp. DHT2]MDR4916748.1 ATP-grasp domain-containing protein [Bacillus pseudomycoides]
MAQQAFLLFGGFTTGKYPNFITAIEKYDLDILVIDVKNDSTELNLHRRESIEGHPFQKIKEFALINPNEIQKVLSQILIWKNSYEIKGVYTIRESFVEILGLVADYLGLPSPGLRASQVCRNKFLQRLYFDKWSPSYVCLTPEQRNEVTAIRDQSFPAILKPISREGSSGVLRVNSQGEMMQALEQEYASDETVLIEQYIRGREYSVETLIQNKKIIFSCPTQKRTNELKGNCFVEMAHTVPAANLKEEEYQKLLDINREIVKKLNFKNGISHAEYKIDSEGNIYLMEIAARNPGDGILQLYQVTTGIPLENILIDIALEKEAQYLAPNRFARQVYFDHTPGILVDFLIEEDIGITPVWLREEGIRPLITPSNHNDEPQIKELLIERKKGDQLFEIKASKDRCGAFIFDSNTKNNLDDLEDYFAAKISIITDSDSKDDSIE